MQDVPTVSRIEPLNPPYSPEIEKFLNKWMPPGAAVEPLKLFRLLARNSEFTNRMLPLGAGILGPTSNILPAEREIVIDRVCARCGCEYEWGVHVASFGQLPGMEKAILTATAPANDPTWNERESLLIRLVDELHDTSTASEELWTALIKHWSEAQLIELIVMVGWYHLISFLANATNLPLESWAAKFPTVAADS